MMKLFQIEEKEEVGEIHKEDNYFYLLIYDKASGRTIYKSINYKTPGRPVNKFYWWMKYQKP